jgi:hypothetical protein
VPPKGLGRVGWRESIFASPTAEKQDAHGGKGLVIKRSEVDLLRTKSWVTLKDPVWLRPLRMFNAKAYSAASATSPLASTTITRRDPTEHDVQIEILFCGICHSDLHQVRNEWSGVMPPSIPASRARDRWPRHQGRLRRDQVQAGRPRRGRLHGGLGRHLPRVQGRASSSSART